MEWNASRSVKPLLADHRIADYAAIGNTHTVALVDSDGAIDWCCLPHFDSCAVFCRLLDRNRGGHFRLGPLGEHRTVRSYREASAVLDTTYETPGGHARVTDFMHSQRIVQSRIGQDDPHCHRLLRCAECLVGEVEFEIAFRPTFGFAAASTRLSVTTSGIAAMAGDEQLELWASPMPAFEIRGDMAYAQLSLRAGESLWIVLSHRKGRGVSESPELLNPTALLAETLRHWAEWNDSFVYDGPYHELVRSSARVLKLLTFGPTGGLVAAPTTSLPEEIGGTRNWDYRYCWLRDAAQVVHALMSIGHHGSAIDFFEWLQRLWQEPENDAQIAYRLDGGKELPERELRYLAGYRGSAPVRIGNAAAGQRQLDVYGHVLDAAMVCLQARRVPASPRLGRVLAQFADRTSACWRQPDQGLWETRGPAQHFLSSKLMCWVALDRAVRLAESGNLEGDLPSWKHERDAVRDVILTQGYNDSCAAFTQALGSRELDASALLIPLVGFLPAMDPRVRSTTTRIRDRLSRGGLVYRYMATDGVAGREGSFAICSYWLVQNLALQGQVQEARALFDHVSSFRSDLDLLAEEIDPVSGELLGNYPQAYTHLALIAAALAIDRAQRTGGGSNVLP